MKPTVSLSSIFCLQLQEVTISFLVHFCLLPPKWQGNDVHPETSIKALISHACTAVTGIYGAQGLRQWSWGMRMMGLITLKARPHFAHENQVLQIICNTLHLISDIQELHFNEKELKEGRIT